MATIQSQLKQSPSQLKPQHVVVPLAESYQPLLEESIHHLLFQIEAGSTSSFSHFYSIFSRIIQTTPSPPIEIIWFYAAVNFRTQRAMITQIDLIARVLALKDLFHLLVSCSGSCGCLESVAVLAPMMSELYNLVAELKLHAGTTPDKKTVESEIDCLVEGVVSFIMICCCRGRSEHDVSPTFSHSLLDLVKVWSIERCAKDARSSDFLKVFFPVISDEVRVELVESREVGYLAGIVMFEVFLLRLYLRVGSEEPKVLGEGLQTLAAETIAGLKCCYFFDVLFEMLLEPTNPVIWFLNPSDDLLLRKVLFDAIIFAELPFLNLENRGQQNCSNHVKSLTLTWVLVVEKAVLFMRQDNNEFKANSYARAFSKFLADSELVGWLTNSHGIEELMNKPVFSTPTAFIDWLSNLQNLCSEENFTAETLKIVEKAARCRLRMNSTTPLAMEGIVEDFNNKTNKSDDVGMLQSQHDITEGGGSSRKRKEEGMIDHPSKLLKLQEADHGFVKSSSSSSSSSFFQFQEMMMKKDRMTEVGGSSIQSHEEDMDVMVQ